MLQQCGAARYAHHAARGVANPHRAYTLRATRELLTSRFQEKFIKEKKDEALPRLLEECGEAKLRELAAGITEERKYIVWDDGELREAATKPTPPV